MAKILYMSCISLFCIIFLLSCGDGVPRPEGVSGDAVLIPDKEKNMYWVDPVELKDSRYYRFRIFDAANGKFIIDADFKSDDGCDSTLALSEIVKNLREYSIAFLKIDVPNQHGSCILNRDYSYKDPRQYEGLDTNFICDIFNLDRTIQYIFDDTRMFIEGNMINSACVFRTIDSLVGRSKSDNNERYFLALEKLSDYSDAELSEYLEVSTEALIDSNFNNFLNFLSTHKESSLNELFVNRFVWDINEYQNMTNDELDSFFADKLNSQSISNEGKSYLKDLKIRIDKKIK